MYVGYVLVMKSNENLRARFDKSVNSVSKIETGDTETGNLTDTIDNPAEVVKPRPTRTGFAGFRAGMLQILMETRG